MLATPFRTCSIYAHKKVAQLGISAANLLAENLVPQLNPGSAFDVAICARMMWH
jgi:hypothetical protein